MHQQVMNTWLNLLESVIWYSSFILQDDLTALGRLVLALACRCLQSVQRDNVQSSIDMVTRNYSTDLRNFIV